MSSPKQLRFRVKKKKLQICDIANCNTSQYLTPNDPEHVHDRSPIGDPQTHETAG
jgi:hypothetical protein